MAKIVKYDSFKRGDTPIFAFTFSEPVAGFDWSTVTIDVAMTKVAAPNDNSGAAALRQNQTLTVDADNSASYEFQPTVIESNALTADTEYKVEAQLKDSGGTNVATAVTGKVKVLQDYVI